MERELGKYEEALKIAQLENGYSQAAEKLLKEAHREGDGKATYALGTWYLHGTGEVKKSLAEAMEYFQTAKERGIGDAYYDLAVCYENGTGVPQSYDQALFHYFMAAFLGSEGSMFEAARMMYHDIADLAEIKGDLTQEMLRISEMTGHFEE